MSKDAGQLVTIERPREASVHRPVQALAPLLIDAAGRVAMSRAKAADARLALGAMLIQVKAQVLRGEYRKVVDDAGIHTRTAQRAVAELLEEARRGDVERFISAERLAWCLERQQGIEACGLKPAAAREGAEKAEARTLPPAPSLREGVFELGPRPSNLGPSSLAELIEARRAAGVVAAARLRGGAARVHAGRGVVEVRTDAAGAPGQIVALSTESVRPFGCAPGQVVPAIRGHGTRVGGERAEKKVGPKVGVQMDFAELYEAAGVMRAFADRVAAGEVDAEVVAAVMAVVKGEKASAISHQPSGAESAVGVTSKTGREIRGGDAGAE